MVFVWKNNMEKLDKTLRYTELFNIYKSQLSATQQEIISNYFFLDLSLSEIASEKNISRSAVEDALRKGISKLDELEDELHFLEKSKKLQQKLDNLKKKALNSSEIEEIEDMKKELDYGI